MSVRHVTFNPPIIFYIKEDKDWSEYRRFWLTQQLDKLRFLDYIDNIKANLERVLEQGHRLKIWKNRDRTT